MHVVTIIFIVATCMLLRLFLLLHRACCYDYFFVAPCMLLRLFLLLHPACCYDYFLLLHRACCYDYCYCCTVQVLRLFLLLHRAWCYDYIYCCTVHIVTIIFIVAPCILLRLFLLLHRECCYDYFPYSNSCTLFIHFKNHQFTLILEILKDTLKKLAPTFFASYIRPSSGGPRGVLYAVTKLNSVVVRSLCFL